MLLHANAVAKNCTAGVRTRRVNRDNSNRVVFLAIETGQLINQRTLPRPRRTLNGEDGMVEAEDGSLREVETALAVTQAEGAASPAARNSSS